MRPPPLLWIPVLAVVATCGLARAQDDLPRLAVVLDDEVSADETLTHLRAAFGEGYTARITGVTDALDWGFGPWGVTAPATLRPCDAAPLSGDELAARMAEVEPLMQALEYGEARSRLRDLQARLCAATEPLPVETVGRIPFLLGITHVYGPPPDPDAAREAFRTAIHRHPDLQWDANFPPDAQELFMEAVLSTVRSPRVVLQLPFGDRPGRLFVDGVEISHREPRVTMLGQRHLLQLLDAAGVVHTLEFDSGGAEEVQWISSVRVRAGLGLTPDLPEGAVAFAALLTAATQRDHTEILVLSDATAELAWRHDVIDRSWSRVSLVLGRQLARAKAVRSTGGVLVGVGGAIAVAGAVLGASNHNLGLDLQDDMESDLGLYHHLIDEYEANQRGTAAGFTLLGVGSAIALSGIPLIVHGTRLEQGALNDPRLSVAASEEGAWIGLSGQF
jgi:hypothetical protein